MRPGTRSSGVTPGRPRCESRGAMPHIEACRKRFDAIEKKKKLDMQPEEARKESELPQVNTVEMEVEQPQEHPMTRGASSSSGVATSGQWQVPVLTRCKWKSLNRLAARGRWMRVTRALASESAVSQAGMLLFDENDRTRSGRRTHRIWTKSSRARRTTWITENSGAQTFLVC